ncbi:MAG TPA: hypothetical protein VN174_04085 [Candidatus Methanoperedens sp.]|nr:hypothetical protein [Candidatus Methanoperedens sp.]
MNYKVTVFIGKEAFDEGWQSDDVGKVLKLQNEFEMIQMEIVGEKVVINAKGNGKVIIIRNKQKARLADKSEGIIRDGDTIWLLNQKAENEFNNGKREVFSGAALKIDFNNLEPVKRQEIFVNEKSFFQERNNKKINFILGFMVLGMLIVGTILGYQKRTITKQKEMYEAIKSQVEDKINEIESVRSVNIDTALELAKNTETLIDNSGMTKKEYLEGLSQLKSKIMEIKQGLGGGNINYEVAYDSALISEGNDLFQGMATKDSIFYLWSATLGQINMVDPELKSTDKVVSDERIKTWLGIFNNGEKWFGYDQKKVYEIKRNDIVESEINNKGNIGEMVGWNGLTYFLDNDLAEIMKLGNEDSKSWLKDGAKLDEPAKSLSIDSKIWVLGASGRIYQYNRGVKENFSMSFLPTVNTVKSLKTTDKVDFLAFVVDDNMVFVYGKDGKIINKYNFSDNKINDIGIENKNNAVLVLTKNGKIYRIKIK